MGNTVAGDFEVETSGEARRLRWLQTVPAEYDLMTEEMAAYLAAIDAPLLAACRGRVLELACGTGRLLRRLSTLPGVHEAVGVDIAPRMLDAAARRGHLRLVQASAEELPFASERFDTVICAFYTLRDTDRAKVYAEVARVLRSGGALAFTLRSYYTVYFETLWTQFLRRGRLPRSWRTLDGSDGVERNLKSVRAEVTALEKAGLRLREIHSLRLLPVVRRWLPPSYWRGLRAAPFGTDVIFVAEKPAA